MIATKSKSSPDLWKNSCLNSVRRSFAIPKQRRSFVDFAKSEIILPNGPRKGYYWREVDQPWSVLALKELAAPYWRQIVATGPSQSGKTLVWFCIPILHSTYELEEGSVVACPEADMADDKWREDLRPVMEASPRLASLIPTRGPGARKGSIKDHIQFDNGVTAKIMTKGGSDQNKAGFTAKYLYITEAAGWSDAKETSLEADAFRQLQARLRSFSRADRKYIIEGTVQTADVLPWKMRKHPEEDKIISSESVIVTPCPHCGNWVAPEREHFHGYRNAKSEWEAEDSQFHCPACDHPFTEDERIKSNCDCKLIHRGQHVDPKTCEIVGDMPKTRTLWFRHSAWHNLFTPQSDLGVDLWEADQVEEDSGEEENAEKAVCQFIFASPYEPKVADGMALDKFKIRKRKGPWKRGEMPVDTDKFLLTIDVGDWTNWYKAISYRENKTLHVPAYGAFDVKLTEDEDAAIAILRSLRQFRDEVVEVGFNEYVPEFVGIDVGYQIDVIAQFIRESNKMTNSKRYIAMRGRGHSNMKKEAYNPPKKKTQLVRAISKEGRYYLEKDRERKITVLVFDADYHKLWYQRRFTIELKKDEDGIRLEGLPGAICLYHSPDRKEHAKLSNHIVNEQLKKVEKENGKGVVEEWIKRGQNHLLDTGAMQSALSHYAGFRVVATSPGKGKPKGWWNK